MNGKLVLLAILGTLLVVLIILLGFLYYENYIDHSPAPIPIVYPWHGWNQESVEIQGKNYALSFISKDPLIVHVEDFLSDDEIQHLKSLAKPNLKASTVKDQNDNYVSQDRTSKTTFLDRGQDNVVKAIEERASAFTGYPVENLEPLQVLRYKPGQYYKSHYDYFESHMDKGGQRHATLFAYLSNIEEGGQTHFPELDVEIQPKKGSVVFWYNCLTNGQVDSRTLHQGKAPVKGTKWGCNIWIRQAKY